MKRGNRGNEDGFVGGEDAEGVGVGAEEDVSAVAIVVSLEEGGDLVDVAALRVSGDPKPHIGDHRRDVHEHAGQQVADLHQLQVHPLRLTARLSSPTWCIGTLHCSCSACVSSSCASLPCATSARSWLLRVPRLIRSSRQLCA